MKITNTMISQLLSNKEKIKELAEQNAIIEMGIRANGGAKTKDYMCVLVEKSRRSVAPMKAFDLKFGPKWLEKNGLLTYSTWEQLDIIALSSRKTSKVG